jgi:hypothetical protein
VAALASRADPVGARMGRMRVKIVLDCRDLDRQAAFWSDAAGYEVLPRWTDGYLSLRASDPRSPDLLLQRVPEAKQVKNRLHLDLHPEDGPATVERLRRLGATLVGDVQDEFFDDDGTRFQVMLDPESNEFCVVWRTSPAARD